MEPQQPVVADHGYRPSIGHGEVVLREPMSVDQCATTIRELDDSQLVGGPAVAVAVKGDVRMLDVAVRSEPKAAGIGALKRKRGRPPRVQGQAGQKQPPPAPPPQRMKEDEEDVCFICFDGGSLVLCDRRGCPKAYHPSCIKRDEAFFRSKAKWNCGWHICSSCQKASHYMCYTCTYSLCKGCTKDADYLCVRGNKGLCGTCMRTIMLIENISHDTTEKVQVDFDDKTSWEYLFKVYWVYLKSKLSLTLEELTQAKNPWKGEELPKAKNSWKGAFSLAPKVDSSGELSHVSDKCCTNLDGNQSKRRKTRNQPMLPYENFLGREPLGVNNGLAEGTVWATKELLEFVAHVRNGDVTMLSQFDVQSLLLEYIKRNNLRDPSQKSQIICDSLLTNLFGKERIGHFEMLKLVEFHFLIKGKTPAGDAVRAAASTAVGSQVEAAENNGTQTVMGHDRRRKTRKRTDEIVLQHNTNPDDYAAIDAYNINLLYLKRSLMENLMDDAEKFHQKVVGSFVRIRIPGGEQKQDIYRLVQVIGTSKVEESYKVGTRTTNVMLEILNLDKKEVVPIDEISNQDFSEDECKRLRQSIKCGLIKRLKVGEIQTKAMALQAVKVSEGLEAEILRLNHLRDRASEKGHRKELRECVEKLELLKSPAELQRRLLEVAYVHTDPKMEPSYESDEDAMKKPGDHLRPKSSVDGRTGVELNSAVKAGDVSGNIGSCEQSSLDTTCKQSQNIVTTTYADRDGTTLVHERLNDTRRQVGEQLDLNDQYKQKNLVGLVGSVSGDCHTEAVVRCESLSGVASPALPAASAGQELSVSDVETDKLWHYQDPYGKVQGPFSMMQLRKWSTSGLFPLDLRVWRITDKQDDSILLTDALVGRFHKDLSMQRSDFSELQESMVASNDVDKRLDGSSQIADGTFVGNKNADDSLKSVQNDESIHCNGDDERARSNERYSHSSSWTTLVDVAISSHGLTQSPSQGWETSKSGKSSSDQPEICGSVASPSTSGKVCESPSPPVRNDHLEEKLSSSPNNLNENSLKTIKDRSDIRETDGKRAESDSSSQSSGQNWRQPIKDSSSGWDSNSGFVSAAKSVEISDLNQGIDFSDLPSPTPNRNHEGLKEHADANKQSAPSTVAVLDSGPTWSTASSSVVGRGQVPEIAREWGGSMTPSRPPAEEWDSNLVSASSLKPSEGASDHTATPTPESGQLTHSPPTHPVIDASSWPLEPEFCSLADESVSDLLAEVEAMESLAGMPSPTSKLRCVEDLAQCSDNDCFSPVEGFCPTPEPGKSDALSSTGDIPMSSQLTVADDPLQLCLIPSQPIVTDGLCQMPSQLPLTDQQLMLSQMPSRPTATADLLGASQMPSPPTTLTDETLKVSHTVTHKPSTSFSSHSCLSAEGEGDRKLSEASVNEWERGSERQPPTASTAKRETDIELQPPIASTAGQGGSVSNVQRPASSAANASWGTVKGNTNMLLDGAAAHSKTNMVWGTNHGTIQNHASANSATSAGNPGSWGSQPRYVGDRTSSGPRDHRNYYQGRDSVFGRDRSWNKQPLFGGGNGGGSHRHPPKGQRVCKFYESGYCKKGASCSYWHP